MIATLLFATALIQEPGPIKVTLDRNPTGLDFAGSKTANQMYMPSSLALSDAKPGSLKQPPVDWGTTTYGEIKLGNGKETKFLIALQVNGEESRLWADLNQDGDLTNDPAANWEKKPAVTAGGIPSWQGTTVFPVSYRTGGKEVRAPYGINFYWSLGRKALGYFRATVLTGSATVNGRKVQFRLHEDANDGVFSNRFDTVPEPDKIRPITLTIDEARKDSRGTFEWDGVNYLASVSSDGSKVTLTPTFRIVKGPVKVAEPTKPLLTAGTLAPDFQADAVAGSKIKLSDYRGKIVVLKFWATWCGPCIASMPHFEQLYKKTQPQGVELVALCVSDDREAFDKWVPANRGKYSFPLFFDPAGRDRNKSVSASLYNVTGIPTVYIINREGKVSASVVGYLDGDKRVDEALAKLGIKVN